MNLYQPYTVYPATSTNRLTFDLRSNGGLSWWTY